MADLRSAENRMESHELKQERFRHEEQEANIQRQLREGTITEEEAQARLARGRMHVKIDEEGSAFRVDEATAAGAGYQTTQQILEDVLDTDDKVYCVKWIKQVTGYAWLKKKKDFESQKRKKPEYKHRFPSIEKLVHGKAMRVAPGMSKTPDQGSKFEIVLGFILLVNCLLIGVSVSADPEGSSAKTFELLEHIFTAIFTIELILRFISDGWIWIMEMMNFLDFILIVGTGILPMWILLPLGIKSGAMRMMQVLRALRLVKLVRMVRTVPVFRIFWTLLRGLMDSGRTLLWTYVMLFAVLYVFAIFGVFLIGKPENYTDDEAAAFANLYFGDVPKSFITLFQVMTLDSWAQIARPLMQHSDFVAPFFILYILVAYLCLGNLITAVIINNADENGAKDQELKAREKRDEVNREIDELKDIFTQIDADGSGLLSKEEYDEALINNQGGVAAKFAVLGVPENERDEVFDLLDTGSGEISIDMFAAGLRDMQGDAKAKDSFTICKKVSHINKNLGNLSVRLKRQQENADELRKEITEAHRQMGGLLVELKEVMKFLTFCVPAEECRRPQKDILKLDHLLQKRKEDLANIGLPQEVTGGGGMRTGSHRAAAKSSVRRTVGFSEAVENVDPSNLM